MVPSDQFISANPIFISHGAMKFEIVHDKSHLFIYFLLFAKDMAHLRTILESTATLSDYWFLQSRN